MSLITQVVAAANTSHTIWTISGLQIHMTFASVCKLLALASLLERAAAFTTATTLLPLRTHGPRHAITASPGGVVAAASPAFAECRRVATPKMGLFGLGWAELGVIGVIALFFFGPEKLAPLAKDFGKSASGLKVGATS